MRTAINADCQIPRKRTAAAEGASLFDQPAQASPIERRDAGADAALDNAGAWREKALAALEGLARRMPELTSDELRADLLEEPPHPNSWGAVFLAAARRGWIRRTERVRPSTRAEANGHLNLVWESLICEGRN